MDVTILETGLGGRLDATNICEPEVCVITSIGLDHQEYLGPTVAHIAAEKAGVAVTDRGFINVGIQMRTNVPHIFAIGDIV